MVGEYPKAAGEAVNRLFGELSDWDKLIIKNTPEEDLSAFHLSLGNCIRNDFGLWRGNDELLEDCLPQGTGRHADDASSVIMKALWKSLQASA